MSEIFMNYIKITNRFLSTFNTEWDKILENLGIKQVQLTIGHKLRPQICMWGYLANISPVDIESDNFEMIARVAASIELIHKASLILDDWIDDDVERHGQPTFHTEYMPDYAVISALNMISLSLSRIEELFPPSIILPHHYNLCIKVLINTINSMALGALEEISLQPSDLFNNEKIHRIAQLETSEIIGNALLLGYYAGLKKSPNKLLEQALKEIGDQCGYIFQVFNDLEIFSNPQQVKKHKGNFNFDLFSNRKNLAIVSLFESANKKEREMLYSITEEELLFLMQKYKIVETLRNEMQLIFNNILNTITKLKTCGVSLSWCESFNLFLLDVKKYAEKRL